RESFRTKHPALLFERLTFGSLGGVRISGYALWWKDDPEKPLAVHGHGYGGGLDIMWHWATEGVNVLGLEVRGYGRSKDALPARSPWGYVLTGIESPEEHVLRGAVCDYMRAVEIGRELLGSRTSHLVLSGASFAGGLAVMAEGLLQAADLLAVAVPSLGWVEGRRLLASKGSAGEINRYLEEHPEREEDLMEVLRYFDPMNLAPCVRCPTLVGVALADNVVPAPTVYAIADHLGGPREVVTWPASHSDLPEEDFFRERFESYWFHLAKQGIPPSFGKTETTED
ncbi:MAG TPA: acetylxylan esterase, partial [Rubrobacteraceae bacterium]|nr:acetylxylan esterase [Rubrobacteraceae bacterium]